MKTAQLDFEEVPCAMSEIDRMNAADDAAAVKAGLACCPFCSGPPELIVRPENRWLVGAFAGCRKCEMHTPVFEHEAEAVAAWNRRAQPPALAEAASWLHKAYDHSPQTDEIESMIARIDAAVLAANPTPLPGRTA